MITKGGEKRPVYSVMLMFKNHPAIRAIVAAIAATVAMLVLARVYATFPGDAWALQELLQLRGGWLDGAAMAASALGQGGIGWGIAFPWVPVAVTAAALAMRRWADAVFLALSTLAPAVNLGIKELVARPRPDVDLWLVAETGFAFPSGHSVFAAAFLGALVWMLGRPGTLEGWPVLRRITQGVLLLLILAVGASRVYMGVHWPSDVIGGFLFGALYLWLLISARRWLERRRAGP